MNTSKIWSQSVVLHAFAVVAGVGVLFDAFGELARCEPNPLCATPEVYDLDGSGMVAPADILALIDGMNGPDPQSPQWDIDGSGKVNELDIDALASQIEACSSEQNATAPNDDFNLQVVEGEPQILVTLTPTTPGPYPPGQPIMIVVSLQRVQAAGLIRSRLIRFDLALSSPALGVTYPITHPFADGGPITFWDFSSTPICTADPADCGTNYFIEEIGALLNTTYYGLTSSASYMITIPADATPVPVGLLQVTILLASGVYRLDMMNAANSDVNFGAVFQHGFGTFADPNVTYRASTGQFAGGILDLVVGHQECVSSDECLDDGSECTDQVCVDEVCQYPPKNAGTPCGNPIPFGICDLPDQCDGSGLCSQNFATCQVVCRAAQSECDQAEHCTGQSANCPLNSRAPIGTPCGAQDPQGPCDAPDTCNGAGGCLQNLTLGGTSCRAAIGECDRSEFCSGLSPACPEDLFVSNGTPCSDDGDECTVDACDGAGQCDHADIVGCRHIPTVST